MSRISDAYDAPAELAAEMELAEADAADAADAGQLREGETLAEFLGVCADLDGPE